MVRQLDGLPLAIELAASRSRVLSPRDLKQRLAEPLQLLRTGRKDLTARQATIEGAIAWSWDLLSAAEQSCLAQLSVFVDGFTLAAAEQVVELGEDPPDTLDVIEALVEKSLVRSERGGDGVRFSLISTIKAYAEARLPSQSEATVRHARFYARFGTREHRLAARRTGGEALSRAARRELENLRAAALRGDQAAAVACARAYAPAAVLRGVPNDALGVCDGVERRFTLTAAEVSFLQLARIGVLGVLGRSAEALTIAEELRSTPEGLSPLELLVERAKCRLKCAVDEEAVAQVEALLARRRDLDGATLADVLLQAARIAGEGNRVEECLALNQEAVHVARAQASDHVLGFALGNLGGALIKARHFDEAERILEQARATHVRVGNRVNAANVLAKIGTNLLSLGRYDDGVAAIREALDEVRPLGATHYELQCRYALSRALLQGGRGQQAWDEAGAALLLASGGGVGTLVPWFLSLRVHAALLLEDAASARRCLEEMNERDEGILGAKLKQMLMAAVLLAEGRPEEAWQLLPDAIEDEDPVHARLLDQMRLRFERAASDQSEGR